MSGIHAFTIEVICMSFPRYLLITLFVLLSASETFGQQSAPKREVSNKYRTILTIAGAGAGFATGFYIGFNAYDDAVNSERKLWTTSAIGAAGGAVGGYFIGR